MDTNTITNGICTAAPTPTTPTANLPASADIPDTGEAGSGSLQVIGLLLILIGGLSLVLIKHSRNRVKNNK